MLSLVLREVLRLSWGRLLHCTRQWSTCAPKLNVLQRASYHRFITSASKLSNFYAISFLHFWTVRKCNSIPLFSQKYVFFWSHHHKYFLSERLRLNTFYEYCKDLKPKLFYFPVHFKEQTLDHFSDKLTLKGFWQVWLRDNVLYKWAKMMLIIREDNRDNPTILNKNTVQQPIGEIIKTKPFEKPVSRS